MHGTPLTRLAILGTIADLHRQPLQYNLAFLKKLVAERNPDLLYVEITTEVWSNEDFKTIELEVYAALTLIEASTDIVLVPVASSMKQYTAYSPEIGWRRHIAQSGMRMLRWGSGKPALLRPSMAYCSVSSAIRYTP